MEDPPGVAQDQPLADALSGLASPTRLALLRLLRTPKALREIELLSSGSGEGAGRPLARQTIKEHLDKLAQIGVVLTREAQREYGPTTEYFLNHQTLFALSEEFRGLAKLRPAEEPQAVTVRAGTSPNHYAIRGPCLVLVKGLSEGVTFDLQPPTAGKPEWIVGRRRGVQVSLDFDPFVSSENSRIVLEQGTYKVEDLPDSRNGTQLNFRPVPKGIREPLRTGDLVGVGRSLLMFRS